MKKALILRPHPTDPGGVAYYYHLVEKYFNSKRISLEFYYTGKKPGKENFSGRIFKTLFDLYLLVKNIKDYDLIILNPSLDPKSVIRDGIFHIAAKRIHKKKTLVFFHGWKIEFEQKIEKYGKRLFKSIFNFDKACVLSAGIKKKLMKWGFNYETIILETTVYEQHDRKAEKDPYKIVFLSRFVKGKGCLEAIRTIEKLVEEFPNVKLYMVGDGEMSAELKNYVTEHNLKKYVEFTGYLSGEKKYHILDQSGVMLYPTYYGEGMPISLLEGMGMGLAIVTRPDGGISDIITPGENGFLVQSIDPNDFAVKIKFLFQNFNAWETIYRRNIQKAQEQFEIKNVVKRLEKLYFDMTQ